MTTKEHPHTRVASYCPDSPTGAHHWVLETPSATTTGACKYCSSERAFNPFDDSLGFNNAPKR